MNTCQRLARANWPKGRKALAERPCRGLSPSPYVLCKHAYIHAHIAHTAQDRHWHWHGQRHGQGHGNGDGHGHGTQRSIQPHKHMQAPHRAAPAPYPTTPVNPHHSAMPCVRAYVRAGRRVCVRACVRACVSGCGRVCACVAGTGQHGTHSCTCTHTCKSTHMM